jgi:arylsulfatase A-like enzyme
VPRRPNIVLVLADDLGFSDLGCYGSEIRTPHLDALGDQGARMTAFYNTARCSPSRASLLTGLHPHQTGVGILTGSTLPEGYPGTLTPDCATMAEVLGDAGYRTALIGKWHLSTDISTPGPAWPSRRGFQHVWGPLGGSCSYFQSTSLVDGETPVSIDDPDFYLTEELGRRAESFVRSAADGADPFFVYLAFTAPHWPLHAPESAIESVAGRYAAGWDETRHDRLRRMVALGMFDEGTDLTDRDPAVVPWADVADQEWQQRRMEVYAAQVELMDAAVGRVVAALEETGTREDTLVIFLSDNGGCAEEIAPGWVDEMDPVPYSTPARTLGGERVRRGNDPTVVPGGPQSFASYGRPWAQVSNAPFREYKHWVHEGGIATPLIASWPSGGLTHGWVREPGQLPDLMTTVLEATGTRYPERRGLHAIPPPEGRSLLAAWKGEGGREPEPVLYFEHEGNAAIRQGAWKAVRRYSQPWELYDLARDRTERHDLAASHPERLADLVASYARWAQRCGVRDRAPIVAGRPAPGRAGGLVAPFVSSVPAIR